MRALPVAFPARGLGQLSLGDNDQARLDYLEGEPPPEVFAERMIFGDPETCIEKLERLRELLRPTRLVCNVQLAALPLGTISGRVVFDADVGLPQPSQVRIAAQRPDPMLGFGAPPVLGVPAADGDGEPGQQDVVDRRGIGPERAHGGRLLAGQDEPLDAVAGAIARPSRRAPGPTCVWT